MKARAWGEASQPGRYCHSTWGVIWARLTAVLLPEASCQWESKGVNAELPPLPSGGVGSDSARASAELYIQHACPLPRGGGDGALACQEAAPVRASASLTGGFD